MADPKDLFRYVKAKGYPDHVAAGILGNISQESNFNPSAINPKSKAFGLFQYLGVRKTGLQQFAASKGKDINDPFTQIDFMHEELTNPKLSATSGVSGVHKLLMSAKTTEEAATVFSDHFEKAGDFEKNNTHRIKVAESLMASDTQSILTQSDADLQQQALAEEIRRKNNAPSFMEGLRLGRDLNAVGPSVLRQVGDSQFPLDPNFVRTPDSWTKEIEGVPEEYIPRLMEAHSQAHSDHIKQRIAFEAQAKQKLSDMGMSGVAANVLSSVLDETALAGLIATEGAALPWIIASKARSIARIGKAAVVGGATNAGISATVQAGNKTDDSKDILYAAAIGAMTGPLAYRGLRGHVPDANFQESSDVLRNIANDLHNEAEVNLGSSVGAAEARVVRETPHNTSTTDDMGAAITEAASKARSKIAEVPVLGPILEKARFSLAAAMKNSNNDIAKYVGSKFIEDALDGGEVSAALIKATEHDHIMGPFASKYDSSYFAWKKENWEAGNPLNIFDDAQARKVFAAQVDEAVRTGQASNKAVMDIARHISEDNKKILRMLKDAEVAGAEEIPENSKYLMRSWSTEKFQHLHSRYGANQVRQLIAGAINKANNDVAPELTEKVSNAIFKRFFSSNKSLDDSFQRLFGSEKLDDIEEFLTNIKDGSNDADIEHFLDNLRTATVKAEKDGRPKQLKRRILLDEGYVHTMVDEAGNATSVPISALFNNDAYFLHASYVRQMTGHYAMAMKGIKSNSDWNDLLRRAEDFAVDNKHSPKDLETVLNNMDFIRKDLLGKATTDDHDSIASNVLRLFRDNAFIRMMGQTGFAQLPEFAATVAQTGTRAAFAHMPELREIVKGIHNGNITPSHGLFKELEEWIGGFGYNRALNYPNTRVDELGGGGHFGKGWFTPALEKLDVAQQYGKRLTGDLSGMNHITAIQDRMAAVAISQKFLHLALKPSEANLKRLSTLGLSEDMLKRVLVQIEKNATHEPSFIAGRKLKTMGFDKWDDPDAFAAYRYAVNRWSRRLVQQNLLGEGHPLLGSAVGKTLTQFRSFVLNAYEKQLLHNVMLGDSEAVAYALTGTVFGGLAYILQTSANSVGQKDQAKYLKDKLTVENIGLAGFQRSGMSTLIPGSIDTLLGLTGRDPVFTFRSSGQDTSFLTGNPVVATVNQVGNLFKSAGGLATNPEYHLSKEDAKNFTALVPLKNALGIRTIFERMQEGLPKRSLEDY